MNFFGTLGTIALLIFSIIAILAPIWLYFINIYTGGSRDELKKIRKLLEQLAEQNKPAPVAAKPTPQAGRVTCPSCGKETPYPAKYAGQEKPCPGCKTKLTLQ